MLLTNTRVSYDGSRSLFVFACFIVLLLSVPAAATDLSFSPSSITWSGDTPVAVVAADFNGGGTKDLAVLSNSTVTLLSGNGDGTFENVGFIDTGVFFPITFAAGDFNHDGKPDLAIVDQFSSEITILTNNGTGSFSSSSYPAVGTNLTGIAAGDFNGDGWDDLALLGSDGASISLYLNNHFNSFTASPDSNATAAKAIKTADYNHDGYADLLAINSTGYSVAILLGQANGSFIAGPSKSLTSNSLSVAMADFDADGISDLAIAATNWTAYILPGIGNGTFGPKLTLASGIAAIDSAAADFNNDGKIDLVIASQGIGFNLFLNTTTHLWNASYPKPGTATTTSIQLLAKLLVAGNVYAVCQSSEMFAAPPPTSEQVKNGQDGFGNFLSDNLKGSVTVAANNEASISCSFLSQTTAYDVYVVAEAASPPYLQASPIKISIATAPETPSFDSVTSVTARGFTANWTMVAFATSYQLDVSTDPDFSSFAANYNSLDVGFTNSFAVTGLSPNTTYYTRVRAVFSGSASASSNVKSLTTLPVPAAPVLSAATEVSAYRFTANWGAVANATSYSVDVASDAEFLNPVNIYNNWNTGSATSYPIYVFNAGSTYYYRVRSNDSIESSYSSLPAAITLPPSTPFAYNAATSTSGFTAAWAASTGVGGYRLDVSSDPGFSTYLPGFTNRDVGNVLSFLVSGTTPGGTYYFRVRAYNSGPYTSSSQTITVSVPAVPPIVLNAPRAYLTGTVPAFPVSTDFNGDGKNDLVTLSPAGSSFTIHLGNGDGTYNQLPATATNYPPSRVVTADFNNDGKLDLAITNSAFTSYSIFLGTGTGTFQPEIWNRLTTPGELVHIASGDLNGDGKADLVITSSVPLTSDNTAIHTLLGSGTGTFVEKAVISCGKFPQALVVAHLDNDNRLDILAATNHGNQLEILYGMGDGTASPTVTLTAPGVNSINVRDFNDDGRPDIALTNYEGFFTIYLQSTVARTFINASAYFPGSGLPGSLATGDFDKDGKTDLAAAIHNSSLVTIFTGDGTGHLTARTDIPLDHTPTGIVVTDLNRDGADDLVTNGDSTASISVALNSGSGTFPTPVPYTVYGAQYRTATGDFNGDGFPDLAVANYFSGVVSILLGSGTGTFGPPTTFSAGNSPYDVASGDFNGDGNLDLVVSSKTLASEPAIYVLIGNGAGAFAAPIPHSESARTDYLVTGDFNQDGKLDVIVNNSAAGTVSVLLGNGNGSFGARTDYPAGGEHSEMILADLNSDGFPDVVTANLGGYISILAGTGDGTLLPAIHYWTGSIKTVASGSFTSSGRVDLAVDAGLAGGVMLLLNTTLPSFESSYPQVVATTATTAQVLVKSTVGGRAYAVCLPAGSPAPSTAQIKAGLDADDAAVSAGMKGSTTLVAHTSAAIPLSTLTSGNPYYVYVILEDALNTVQPVPGFVSFTQPLTVPQLLTVSISGIGTVYSSSATAGIPGNITCTSGACSASYPEGSTVNLTASPSWYSTTNWGGTDSSSGTTASVVMGSARTVTADFVAAQNVQLSSPAEYLGSIKLAIEAATDGSSIHAKSMHFPDLITFSKADSTITLFGGFVLLTDVVPGGYSTIHGPLSITHGRLNIKGGVKVRQ